MKKQLIKNRLFIFFLLANAILSVQSVAIGQVAAPLYHWSFASPTSQNGAVFVDSIAAKNLTVSGDLVLSVQGVRNSSDKAVSFPLSFSGTSSTYNTRSNTEIVSRDFIQGDLGDAAFTDFPVSISAWIKTSAVGGMPVSIGNVLNDGSCISIHINGSGRINANFRNLGTTRALAGDKVVNDGRWHHVVVIFDKGTGTQNNRRIYVDNVLDKNANSSGSFLAMPANLNTVRLGGQIFNDRNFYNGALDEVKIYNKRLDPEAINNLYLEGDYASAPDAPTHFTATIGVGNALLKWNPVVNPKLAGYLVYQQGIAQPFMVTDTFKLLSPINSGFYRFYVAAITSNSNVSDTVGRSVSFYLSRDLTAPSKPGFLKIIARESDAILSFPSNKEVDLKGYFIYRNGVRSKNSRNQDSIFSKTILKFNGASLDTFMVSAVDSSGNESIKSNAAYLGALHDVSKPFWNGSDNFSFASTPANGYRLTWSPAQDSTDIVTSYDIYMDDDSIPITTKRLTDAEILTLTTPSAFSFGLVGTVPGQTYRFTIKAKDDRLNMSNPLSITVKAPILTNQNVVFPSDAGIVNVLDYGAKGDGITDDTKAIQAALNAFLSSNRIVYLPNGKYLVSDILRWGPSSTRSNCSNCWKRIVMMGQTREGVVIKLKDNSSGYQGTSDGQRKGVIWTGLAPAQRFRNGIRNLTINTGKGNNGAAALQLNTSNQGYSDRLNIISEDGQGHCGLDFDFTGEIGPGYVNDIFIDGFRYGIYANALNSMTLENVTVQNQSINGINNVGRLLCIRNLTSNNTVTAIKNSATGDLCIINGKFNSGASGAAIENAGTLYAKNIVAAGYTTAINNTGGNGKDATTNAVAEFSSHDVTTLLSATKKMINLPVKDMPEIVWGDSTTWVSPLAYGAIGNGTTDDTQAIQAAIDNTTGKKTVYFPGNKTFRINGTLYIRGGIRNLIGVSGRILGSGTIVFQDGAEPVVVMHDFDFGTNSTLTLRFEATRALRMGAIYRGINIISYGTGDFFLTDIATLQTVNRFYEPRQKIWMRQFNPEKYDSVNVLNNGADLWMLGFKTEGSHVKLLTKNGGRSEVIGIHNYSTDGSNRNKPFFVCDGASLSFVCFRETHTRVPATPYINSVGILKGQDTIKLNTKVIPFFVSTFMPSITWVGNIDTVYAKAGNWSPAVVPTERNNIVIASASNSPVVTGTQAINAITVNNGATIRVKGTLQVADSIKNSGFFNVSEGTLELNGTSAQVIPPTSFTNNTVKNLVVNNAEGVTLAGSLNLSGVLTPLSGVLTTNGNLTLLSTDATSAAIATGAGQYINGSVTVQRYTQAQRGYRTLAHPYTTAQTVSQLTDNFQVTGLASGPLGTYGLSTGAPFLL